MGDYMELGKKIRSLRKELGKSLEDLAKEAGLSIGLLSQIERDITGPSVESLWKIAKALNVSMNYFFDNYEENNPVVRKNERKQLKLPNSNVTYELLSPNLNRKIEFLIVKIEPGQCNKKELIAHEGEECGYVIKGKLKIKWGDKEYILEEGDSIYFDSTVPHRFINIGDEECISIWAMTPPSF